MARARAAGRSRRSRRRRRRVARAARMQPTGLRRAPGRPQRRETLGRGTQTRSRTSWRRSSGQACRPRRRAAAAHPSRAAPRTAGRASICSARHARPGREGQGWARVYVQSSPPTPREPMGTRSFPRSREGRCAERSGSKFRGNGELRSSTGASKAHHKDAHSAPHGLPRGVMRPRAVVLDPRRDC